MDYGTYVFYVISCLVFYYWGHKDCRSRERLSAIKALMREQNERVIARPPFQTVDYQTLWVDIWVEVAPHED